MAKHEEKKKKVSKYTPKIPKEDRIKQIMSIQPPETNLFKKEDEPKIDRWRPMWRGKDLSIAEERRLAKRNHRPKKPQRRFY